MTPLRVQRRRARGWRMPPNTVYVGRPTLWGNPGDTAQWFIQWLDGALVEPVNEPLIARRQAVLDALAAIRGKNLACFCKLCHVHADGKPLGVTCDECAPCHADVLLELANGLRIVRQCEGVQ